MGLLVSCMPMNQPLKVKRLSVAGAAQIRTKKYSRATDATSAEQGTTASTAVTKSH